MRRSDRQLGMGRPISRRASSDAAGEVYLDADLVLAYRAVAVGGLVERSA